MSLPAEDFVATLDYVMELLDGLPPDGYALADLVEMADHYAKLFELRKTLEQAAQLMSKPN